MPKSSFRPSRTGGRLQGFELTGFKELYKTLEELPREIAGPIVSKSFRAGANVVRDGARKRAPHGRSEVGLSFNRASSGSMADTSTSKTISESVSVITPSRAVRGRTMLVFIVRCRHALAHIFEYGTVDRVQKTTGRRTGKITPHPFMRPALDVDGPRAIETIKEKALALIDAAARRIAKKNKSVK